MLTLAFFEKEGDTAATDGNSKDFDEVVDSVTLQLKSKISDEKSNEQLAAIAEAIKEGNGEI